MRILSHLVGVSPSGKAPVFGTGIPRFESWYPSHTSPFGLRVAYAIEFGDNFFISSSG